MPADQRVCRSDGALLDFVYDTNRYPISFDVCWALSWADLQRARGGCESIGVTILNLAHDFVHSRPEGHPDYVSRDELRWRIQQIIVPIVMMHKSVSRVSIADAPVRCDGPALPGLPEMYRDVLESGGRLAGFTAGAEGRRALELLFRPAQLHNLVSITVRESDGGAPRNSQIDQWNRFAERIQAEGYQPVFVPDTTRWFEEGKFAGLTVPVLALNMQLRMALYEAAKVNLFVNSGPAALCCLTPDIPYLTFKILTAGEHLASEAVVSNLGFKIGETPPFATSNQKWIWEDDTYQTIYREFSEFCRRAQAGSNCKGPVSCQ